MLAVGEEFLDVGAPVEGSYALLADDPLNNGRYEQVEADLVKLLNCLGGQAQLGRRRPKGVRLSFGWSRRRPAAGG